MEQNQKITLAELIQQNRAMRAAYIEDMENFTALSQEQQLLAIHVEERGKYAQQKSSKRP